MPPTTKIALKLEMRELLLSIVAIPAMVHILIVSVTGLAANRSSKERKPWPLRAKVTVDVLALVLVAISSSAPDNPESSDTDVSVSRSNSQPSTTPLPTAAPPQDGQSQAVTTALSGTTTSTTPAGGAGNLADLQINDSPFYQLLLLKMSLTTTMPSS